MNRESLAFSDGSVNNQVTPTSALGLSLTANGLTPTWTAIGSTATVNALTNTLTDPVANASTSVPIYLIDGNKVATGYGDLWDGDILTPINVNPQLSNPLNPYVWTGTLANGTGNPFGFGVLGRAEGTSFVGDQSSSDEDLWVIYDIVGNSNLLPLYGMSSVLTVPGAQPQPVPEPSSLLGIITLGSLMLGGAIRRAKK